MAKLTLSQLERHLFAAADIFRGALDATEGRDYVFGLLLLKRASDEFHAARERIAVAAERDLGMSGAQLESYLAEPATYAENACLFVPPFSRWEALQSASVGNKFDGSFLNRALYALTSSNDGLRGLFDHLDFNAYGRRSSRFAVTESVHQLNRLIEHFSRLRLRTEDLAFPDLLGAACESLLKVFADASGRKGTDFYTPRAVVRLMVNLARPRQGMRIYDPCAGSGGMLIHSREYIEERDGDATGTFLAGQDANSASWTIAAVNMLLHGVRDGLDLRQGDTLAEPAHVPRSEDERFDVVLSNPPFAMDYSIQRTALLHSRMPYGTTSERGKADLMFLQHMLWEAKQASGQIVTVLPHGVLFRRGTEQEIRRQLLDADAVEAVIGLAPNLFYGTGIPACILVLRPPGAKPQERRGRVLFVNADREYHAGHAQNELLPEHVERIADVFHAYREMPGFSRIVSREELARNDDNLNIRRYVDNAPPPEPQDVHAHLQGGMPRAEVAAQKDLLASYGIGPLGLFAERKGGQGGYLDFLPEGERPGPARFEELARPREDMLWQAFDEVWTALATQVVVAAADRPGAGQSDRTQQERRTALMRVPSELTSACVDRLDSVGLLDRHALAGTMSVWWREVSCDLLTLAENGFATVVDSWVADVQEQLGQVQDPATVDAPRPSTLQRRRAYEHGVVAAMAPGFLAKLAEADTRMADVDAQFKDAGSGSATASNGEEDADAALADESQLRALKRERTGARKAIQQLEADFSLTSARRCLDAAGERDVVLGVLRDALAIKLDRLLVRRRRELVGAYQTWEQKYALSFREIESKLAGSGGVSLSGHNPWSRKEAWDWEEFGDAGRPGVRERHRVARRIRAVIDAEMDIRATLAKLDIDQQILLLPILDPATRCSQEYERLPLRDVIRIGWPGIAGPLSRDADGLPVVRKSNLNDDGMDLRDLRYHPGPLPVDSLLTTGDVLLTRELVGAERAGFASVWRGELSEAAFSLGLLRLAPDTRRLLPEYLVAWLQHRIRPISSPTAVGKVLSTERLLDLEIELPEAEEQRRIVDEITELDEKLDGRRTQLAKLLLIKRTLTENLMTGQMSVSFVD